MDEVQRLRSELAGSSAAQEELAHGHQTHASSRTAAASSSRAAVGHLDEDDVGRDEEQEGDGLGLGLEGLTIVLHMRGKEDLIINTDLREHLGS